MDPILHMEQGTLQHSAGIPPCNSAGEGRVDYLCRLWGAGLFPGCSENAAGRPRLAAQTFFPSLCLQHPSRPAAPAPSPPAPPRPVPGLPTAPHSPHTPRLLHAGPSQARAAGPGGTAGVGTRGGVGGSPGRGWVPQRRFQLFRCLKLAPAERLRSRDGASPIGTGLSPGSGPEHSAS